MNEEHDSFETRRYSCTPMSESVRVLGSLINFWDRLFPESDFVKRFFQPMWDDDKTSGADQLLQLEEVETTLVMFGGKPITPQDKYVMVRIGMLMAACAFCIQAMKSQRVSPRAWSYALDANRCLGMLIGACSNDDYKNSASEFGRLGANALHKENRAMKKEVLDWCSANMKNFKSNESAAEAVAGKIVPVKFRTVRDWIGEWRRLHPAGTP